MRAGDQRPLVHLQRVGFEKVQAPGRSFGDFTECGKAALVAFDRYNLRPGLDQRAG